MTQTRPGYGPSFYSNRGAATLFYERLRELTSRAGAWTPEEEAEVTRLVGALDALGYVVVTRPDRPAEVPGLEPDTPTDALTGGHAA